MPKKGQIRFGLSLEEAALVKEAADRLEGRLGPDDKPTLTKSILNILNGPGSIERLAFEEDPSTRNSYASVYKAKLRLIPDVLLKRIAIQDDLVATIIRTRQNHVSTFGRPRPDRHSVGYVLVPKTGILDDLSPEDKKRLDDQIERARNLLWTCGNQEGFPRDDQMTLSEYFSLSTRSALVCGRIATEQIYRDVNGVRKWYAFRPTDSGTIYKAVPQGNAAQSVRDSALALLEDLKGEKLEPERFHADEYAWIQVQDGRPIQAFTDDEMSVFNFYEVPDIELAGYPVTPLDTVITAVTTHLNIGTHSKLFFQSGRATRGMLVISSDDAEPAAIDAIKQQFNASINSVNNSWRMPVFGVAPGETVTWTPLDSTGGGRDMEFQYLTDMNARVIMSAFMVSPDELPGWSYLSRGTNSQALSEGDQEYKLEAARDVGIRPLLAKFEDFINAEILPRIDADLAKQVDFRMLGLNAENAEKESVRISQDMPLWMTFDDVLQKVEKKPVGAFWGGTIPLNPGYQAILFQNFTVGEILENWCGRKGAAQDPSLAYRRDPFWFQFMQMQQQAAAAQQQPQGPGGPPDQGGGSPGGGGGSNPPAQTEAQKSAASQSASAAGQQPDQPDTGDLARSIDQAYVGLMKSEAKLPPGKRKLLQQHKDLVAHWEAGWLEDAEAAVKEILAVAAAESGD